MTKEQQHTPGRWEVEEESDHPDAILVVDEQGVTIATCWRQPYDPEEWVDANANLIAAAPELLQALEDVERHHIEQNRLKARDKGHSKTLSIVRHAIAKARGGAA